MEVAKTGEQLPWEAQGEDCRRGVVVPRDEVGQKFLGLATWRSLVTLRRAVSGELWGQIG